MIDGDCVHFSRTLPPRRDSLDRNSVAAVNQFSNDLIELGDMCSHALKRHFRLS